MSWRSPNPHFRSAGELVDVKATFSRKRKSRGRPPENEGEGPSEHDSDGFSSPPPKQEGGPSQNPNFEAAVETGAARTVADGEVPQEEDDDAMRVTTNPSSSDHQPPNFNSTESDGVFERRTSDRPNPIPPNPNREDETFTTRVLYNGVFETNEGRGKQYVNGEVVYADKCDPDLWSKLEVDDVLERMGVDVTGLEYYYMIPRTNLDEGLVRLFDNKSALDMAALGVEYGVIDVYAVEVGGVVIDSTQVPVSQLTQEEQVSRLGTEKVARELQFGGPECQDGSECQDGLTASEDDSEEAADGPGDDVCTDGGPDDELGGGDDCGVDDSDDDGASVKGKGKLKGKAKCKGKGKGKAEGGSVKGKGKLKGKAKVKGNANDKGKVVDDEDENIDEARFLDSDYDLSDKEEDDIMAAQVEGWKNVVQAMRIADGSGDEGGSSDNLPSDSPNSGTEPEDDLGGPDDDTLPPTALAEDSASRRCSTGAHTTARTPERSEAKNS